MQGLPPHRVRPAFMCCCDRCFGRYSRDSLAPPKKGSSRAASTTIALSCPRKYYKKIGIWVELLSRNLQCYEMFYVYDFTIFLGSFYINTFVLRFKRISVMCACKNNTKIRGIYRYSVTTRQYI